MDDEDFLECVEILVESYLYFDEGINIEKELKHGKNTTDFIKVLFDVFTQHISLEDWTKNEVQRRNDKTINNKIGEFHQNLLGRVPGWVNLGTGHESGLDLKKEDNSIFIELKNKHNTLNSSSQLTMRNNLENVLKKYPNSTVYWAYIIEKNYESKNEIWEYHEKIKNTNEYVTHYNPQIKLVSGKELYTLVTGDPTALKQLVTALPTVINQVLVEYNEPFTTLSNKEKEILSDYIEYIFR